MSELDEIRAILRDVAIQQQATQQIVASNARAIEANSNAIAELKQRDEAVLTEMRQNIADTVSMITSLGETLQQYSDRNEQDHLRLSAAIETLVNALTQRFGSNGHNN